MKNKLSRIIFLLMTVMAASSYVFAQAEERPAIAVLDFKALGVSSSEAAFVSDFLRSDIVASKAFRVIDRINMEKVLAEQGFQQTGCTTQECAVAVGKILNCKNIVSGNFGKMFEMYQITLNVVSIETGEIVHSDSASCKSPEELQLKTRELADRLAAKLGKPAEAEPVTAAVKEPQPKPAETGFVPEKTITAISAAETKNERNGLSVPVEFPDEEFEPPRKQQKRKLPFMGEEQKNTGLAPYYSFQFSEGVAFPSESTSVDWFFASSLVNDIGLILKPAEKHTLMGFYELRYSGPGLERQEGRVFSERTMDHIVFGQYTMGITSRLKLKVMGNYMNEFQRVARNEEWTSGLYNFKRTGGETRIEMDKLIMGFKGSAGIQVNYLDFPNYTDLLKEFEQGTAAETIGGKQNQMTYAGVIGLTGKNMKINWKSEQQRFTNQAIVESNGQYGSTLQLDENSALSIAGTIGKRFSISPVFIASWKNSNQSYMHYKYVGDTVPYFAEDYYDYSQQSLTMDMQWKISSKFEVFFIPRIDLRYYSSRPPRDVNNDFVAGTLQKNGALILQGGYTRYWNEVSSYSVFYTFVRQKSNMKFEKYQPYNYTGQYVGIKFNFTF